MEMSQKKVRTIYVLIINVGCKKYTSLNFMIYTFRPNIVEMIKSGISAIKPQRTRLFEGRTFRWEDIIKVDLQ